MRELELSRNQMLPSGPTQIANDTHGPAAELGKAYSVMTPVFVMRPTAERYSPKYTLPSGPPTIEAGVNP